jgi:hypothetical protein
VPRPALHLAASGAVTATTALSVARLFEDVGVTAYNGALAALSGSNLTFASQILAVEGFHAGAIRLGVILQNDAAAGTDVYLNAGDNLDVAPFDAGSAAVCAMGPITASGGFFTTSAATATSAGTTSVTTPAGVVVTTPSGCTYARTASQVLNLVYQAGGVAGTTKGGFFPSGVNGLVNTV